MPLSPKEERHMYDMLDAVKEAARRKSTMWVSDKPTGSQFDMPTKLAKDMQRGGYIKIKSDEGMDYAELTPKGEKKLKELREKVSFGSTETPMKKMNEVVRALDAVAEQLEAKGETELEQEVSLVSEALTIVEAGSSEYTLKDLQAEAKDLARKNKDRGKMKEWTLRVSNNAVTLVVKFDKGDDATVRL